MGRMNGHEIPVELTPSRHGQLTGGGYDLVSVVSLRNKLPSGRSRDCQFRRLPSKYIRQECFRCGLGARWSLISVLAGWTSDVLPLSTVHGRSARNAGGSETMQDSVFVVTQGKTRRAHLLIDCLQSIVVSSVSNLQYPPLWRHNTHYRKERQSVAALRPPLQSSNGSRNDGPNDSPFVDFPCVDHLSVAHHEQSAPSIFFGSRIVIECSIATSTQSATFYSDKGVIGIWRFEDAPKYRKAKTCHSTVRRNQA